MPRPFVQLVLEPIVPVSGSSNGGGATDYPQLPGTSLNSYTSNGTIAEVIPTETSLAFGQDYQCDSFVGELNTTGSSFNTIATIAISTKSADMSFSVIGSGAGGITYRADLVCTAVSSGSVLSALLQPVSPANPLNVRSNGGGSGCNCQILQSGNNVLVQVQGEGDAIQWAVIGQIMYRTPA